MTPLSQFKHLKLPLGFFMLLLSFYAVAWEQGKPFIHNYTPKEYKAHTQNWAIVQDYKGIMYFGNNHGVLQYDGVSWELIPLPNNSTVRSLAINSTGRIYVGGVGEFGYLEADPMGKMQYYSLIHLISDHQRNFSNIWSIQVQGSEVYFQSPEYLFHYTGGKVNTTKLTNSYHRSFLVNGNIYLRQDSLGLGIIQWGEWNKVNEGAVFSDKVISTMLPIGEKKTLIGTRKNGLFLMTGIKADEISIEPFPCPASDWLKKNQLYHATQMNSGSIVFASLSGGVIIADETGNIRQKLNINTGLRNNRAYYVYAGKDNALWIAMDNGIAHAEINSPLTRWDTKSGLSGTVYAVQRYKQRLYAGSSDGIFRLEESVKGDYAFTFMLPSSTQTWQFLPFPPADQLLAATSQGIWFLDPSNTWKEVQALRNANCYSLSKLPNQPNRIIAGLLSGIAILEWNGKNWEMIHKALHQQIRSIAIAADNSIWLGTRYNGVIQCQINRQGEIINAKHYTTEDGFPVNYRIYVSNINGDLLIGTPKGLYKFNPEDNTIVPSEAFGKKFTSGRYGIRNFALDKQNGSIWIHAVEEGDRREWLEIAMEMGNKYQLDSVTLKRLTEVEIYSVYPDLGNITWIGGSEGLFRYDNLVHIAGDKAFHAIIRKVELPNDSIVFHGNYPLSYSLIGEDRYMQEAPQSISIPNKQNSITFEFAAPSFENETNTRFSYYLNGYEKTWSNWTHSNRHSYFDLPAGDYKFYVKAYNIYDQESTIATYRFTILAAWYQNPAIWGLTLILTLGIIGGSTNLYSRKVNKDRKRLEAIVWKRTAEVRAQNTEIEEINQALEQQKEELAIQRDQLADSVENMERLSNIGIEVASTLSISTLVQSAHKHLHELVDFSAFGLGFYNEDTEKLEFPEAISDQKQLPNFEYSVQDKDHLAVYSFTTCRELLIKDYEAQKEDYLNEDGNPMRAGEGMRSLIYLPLMVKKKPVGVLTIQHAQPNFFSEYHISLIRNLAIYLAIAVEHAESYHLVGMQKKEIEIKSIEVQHSITYAERIQHAILPKENEIKQHLPDSFVFLKPRNVVSGDFHWFTTKRDAFGNQLLIIAAVDCTGHGVPGAFMSMIGHELLREIVEIIGITDADKILNKLHKMVRRELNQEETGNRDGMDISLCVLDFSRAKLDFAGAKNSLVYLRGNELFEVKGDNQSIGGIQREDERIFTKHTIPLDPEEETSFYLFSDGFQDQFGGTRRRKFTSRRFREFLSSIHQEPIAQQEKLMQNMLEDWMGELPQVDDILVMGFRA